MFNCFYKIKLPLGIQNNNDLWKWIRILLHYNVPVSSAPCIDIWTEEIQFGKQHIFTLFLEFRFDSEIFPEFLWNSLVHSY